MLASSPASDRSVVSSDSFDPRSHPEEQKAKRGKTRLVLITGCSGGGKSTLLAALKHRGYAVVEEPGRRIVAEENAASGLALPWVDMAAFARRAVAMSRSDLVSAQKMSGIVFFDRGLLDAAVALQSACGIPYQETLGPLRPYSATAFVAPPWPEIFASDQDRRHDLKAAIEEFERLHSALLEMHYDVQMLPKISVQERVDFVLENIT